MNGAAKRVLITAPATPVGGALIAALLRDATVERLLALYTRESLPSQASPDPRLAYVLGDIRRRRDMWRLLLGRARDERITALVHDPFQALPKSTQRGGVSADATRELLRLCEEQSSIERIVLRSSIDVYRVAPNQPLLIDEDHPLQTGSSDARIRDVVESDFLACSRIPHTRMQIAVLRCAELLAAESCSEIFDYLCAPLCLHPWGFDPMLNVLSPADAAQALLLALQSRACGVFNIPGKDVLPLSELVHQAGRRSLAVPGSLLSPLYWLRARTTDGHFRYAGHRSRFHYSGILNGARAQRALGYAPRHAIDFVELAKDAAAQVRSLLR